MNTARQPGQDLAVTAEVLYLVNLMLAPGLAFVILLALYILKAGKADALAANHLSQTVGVSAAGGALIVLIIALVVALGGLESGYTWVVAILYFTFVHASLILMGVMGLVKALNGQRFVYPLIGRPFRA